MRMISLHVSEHEYADFQSLAAQEQRPVAQLIREAMREWLDEHRREGHSLVQVAPIDCGVMLGGFDRADVAEEMYDARLASERAAAHPGRSDS